MPDGVETGATMAGPAVTVSFDGEYRPVLPSVPLSGNCLNRGAAYANEGKWVDLSPVCMDHVPGFSTPSDGNEDKNLGCTYPPPIGSPLQSDI